MKVVSLGEFLLEKAKEEDKQQHFWYSFVILIVVSACVNIPAGLVITFLIGLVKEVWDHFYGSGFCWYDMLANCVGILVAFSLLVGI